MITTGFQLNMVRSVGVVIIKPHPLDVEVDVPEILDLSSLRAQGLQSGEEELPEMNDTPQEQSKEDHIDINRLIYSY